MSHFTDGTVDTLLDDVADILGEKITGIQFSQLL